MPEIPELMGARSALPWLRAQVFTPKMLNQMSDADLFARVDAVLATASDGDAACCSLLARFVYNGARVAHV